MPLSDTTPIRDPRNAVGLMADVIKLTAWRGRVIGPCAAIFETAIALGVEFSKSSRRVFNGYERRDGADLYARVKLSQEKLNSNEFAFVRRETAIETIGTLRSLCDRTLDIAELAMRNLDAWKVYTEPQRVSLGYGGFTTADARWHTVWHDHVSAALREGADAHQINLLECNWRFRDLTNRKHRGLCTRAAFEAAWLAGEYKFAKRLLET